MNPASDIHHVPATRRFETLDILRGVALLGILIVNIEYFGGPETLHDIPIGLVHPAFTGWHANLDRFILAFKWIFVEGRMRGLFCMLFGAGVILFTNPLTTRPNSENVADLFLRRCLWLVAFGLLHGTCLWDGDILMTYGLCGLLILFPLRNIQAKKLVIVGSLLWVVGGSVGMWRYLGAPGLGKGQELEQAHLVLSARHALDSKQTALIQAEHDKIDVQTKSAMESSSVGYLVRLPDDAQGFIDQEARSFTSGSLAEVFGSMILGMGLYKLGFLTGRLQRRTYLLIAIIGYSISAPIVLYGLWRADSMQYTYRAALKWVYLPMFGPEMAAALANASIVVLFCKCEMGRRIKSTLAAIGQMAFSNYILTSLICQYIFIWSPAHLYGKLEYYQYMGVVFGVWAVNAAFSLAWLQYFQQGPLEWCWRSLTRWRLQPARRVPRPDNGARLGPLADQSR